MTSPTLFAIIQSEEKNKQKGATIIFTISNGDFYIAQFSTGLKPVRTKGEAIQFKTYDKASSFMLNMPKSFKNLGYHIEGKAEIVKTTQTQACPEVKSSEHKKVTIQRDLSYIKEIEDEISKLEFFISDLQRKRQDAIETVKRCEREEQDFLHCSEGPDKNACDGYKMWHLLSLSRRERRKAKDIITIVDAIFEDNNFDGILSQKTIRRISGLENRVYSVRELDDIFPD